MTQLTSLQRKFLIRSAHHLTPAVQVGQAGATAQVIQTLDKALSAHELIKVKFVAHKNEKQSLCALLSEGTASALVKIIGHVAVFYRQNPDKERRTFSLPGSS